MLKHHAKNMLKSRDTCSNSELENVAIVHRAQDNSWTADNFQSIVFYVWPL